MPFILLPIAGREWKAIIDTGFNGDLELPEALASLIKLRYIGRGTSLLAGNQAIEEDQFLVEVPFEDKTVRGIATFVSGDNILLGTNMLREHVLLIDFPQRTVTLTRTES